MQITTIKCDGCDKEQGSSPFKRQVKIRVEPGVGIEVADLDLCTNCWESLLTQMDPRKWPRRIL